MIKVSDYIAKKLKSFGIEQVFMVTGGGAMHLNDSLGRYLPYLCNHHEQACAIAAEGYTRASGKVAVICITTGPGGINALNGVFGQWTDSIPALYLSGQVKFETTLASCTIPGLRQLGDQEVDIISMVKPITKYSAMVKDPLEIGIALHQAFSAATSGRPGPVWLDIPLDIQGAWVDESLIENNIIYSSNKKTVTQDASIENAKIYKLIDLLYNAKRPLIVAGHGITITHTKAKLLKLLEKLKIPTVTTFNGMDILSSDHPAYIGRIGTIGQRAGNFALQNADLILCLGTRNNIRQISYNWSCYAKNAKKIVVDIDPAELKKPTLIPDLPIEMDLRLFFDILLDRIEPLLFPNYSDWHSWCKVRKNRYLPDTDPAYKTTGTKINPYDFMLKLTSVLESEAIIVAGNGSACVCLFQVGIVKSGQRIFWNSGNASMGYDLPAAIGASLTANTNVICIAGDGSIMMNLQELQTIKHYQLPIKIFVLNNNGYSSIRQTQRNFFEGHLVGCHESSGVSIPSFYRVGEAFGIPSITLNTPNEVSEKLSGVLSAKGPILCEVMLEEDYIFQPKLSSEKLPSGKIISKPLEDMYPFLKREEFYSNMID